MRCDLVDYIIADSFVIPAGDECHAEQIVRLPDCYQANDSKRHIALRTPHRSELGLPERAFVFCCFNNSFKIKPPIFDVWMRLLQQVDESVLWLLAPNEAVRRNLGAEAERRGVASARLVFAPRAPFDKHLARHRLADLFLDTLPWNAHTTASDALWAGLPLLTCAGRAFAARVAGSLLHAMAMPELVTDSLTAYEARALALAGSPAQMRELRDKVGRNRLAAPLFRTDLFRRHIESAYLTMWETFRRGERPHGFTVPRVGDRASRSHARERHEALRRQHYVYMLPLYVHMLVILAGEPHDHAPSAIFAVRALRLRTAASRRAGADAALRRRDGAGRPACDAVLAAAHARADGPSPDHRARRPRCCSTAPRCRATSIRSSTRGLVRDRAGPRRAHPRRRAHRAPATRRCEPARAALEARAGRGGASRLGAAKLDALIATLGRDRTPASRHRANAARLNAQRQIPCPRRLDADWRTPTVVLVCGGLILTRRRWGSATASACSCSR